MAAALERPIPPTVVILGCGDLGERIAGLLPAHWRLVGVRRSPAKLAPPLEALAADYTHPGALDELEALAPDYVITTLKPLSRDGAGYRAGFATATANLMQALGRHRPRGICMVSSTRVYAERDGGWVDEEGSLESKDPAALAIIDAERQVLDCGLEAAVLRCGGLYGMPGGRLLERIATGSICAPEPLHYSNRIHRDDVAGFVAHLMGRAESGAPWGGVYNLVDDCPVPQHEVEQWLAGRLGVDPNADREPAPAHKRCRNRLLAESGYRLRYPDYRAGYSAVLEGE